jgi:hypothetical protein
MAKVAGKNVIPIAKALTSMTTLIGTSTATRLANGVTLRAGRQAHGGKSTHPTAGYRNHAHIALDEVSRQLGKSMVLSLGPSGTCKARDSEELRS